MHRLIAATVFLSAGVVLTGAQGGGSKDPAAVKEALQAFNDFIGSWKGNGASEREKSEFWKESVEWGWRFKGKDVWLTLEMKEGKYFKRGELRYLPDKEVYVLTLHDKADTPLVFEGSFKKNRFTATRKDAKTEETQQLQMYLAGGGVRMIYEMSIKPANRTLFSKEYQVAMTKEGESFGTAAKKTECIVTGGLGTMTVTYKGMTYYVCCSGCRDAFNENPEQVIKDYNAKKKKK